MEINADFIIPGTSIGQIVACILEKLCQTALIKLF